MLAASSRALLQRLSASARLGARTSHVVRHVAGTTNAKAQAAVADRGTPVEPNAGQQLVRPHKYKVHVYIKKSTFLLIFFFFFLGGGVSQCYPSAIPVLDTAQRCCSFRRVCCVCSHCVLCFWFCVGVGLKTLQMCNGCLAVTRSRVATSAHPSPKKSP